MPMVPHVFPVCGRWGLGAIHMKLVLYSMIKVCEFLVLASATSSKYTRMGGIFGGEASQLGT